MTNRLELEGTIAAILPRGLYEVRLDDGRSVRATLGAAARRVFVKVLPGDRVCLELSMFDPSRGRINGTVA